MLYITVYDFTVVGDIVSAHSHPIGLCHISIVAKGGIRMQWTGGFQACGPGVMKQFNPGKIHSFVATVVPARLINIRY
jgi:quercetin dioxygenase-like cupin family protein